MPYAPTELDAAEVEEEEEEAPAWDLEEKAAKLSTISWGAAGWGPGLWGAAVSSGMERGGAGEEGWREERRKRFGPVGGVWGGGLDRRGGMDQDYSCRGRVVEGGVEAARQGVEVVKRSGGRRQKTIKSPGPTNALQSPTAPCTSTFHCAVGKPQLGKRGTSKSRPRRRVGYALEGQARLPMNLIMGVRALRRKVACMSACVCLVIGRGWCRGGEWSRDRGVDVVWSLWRRGEDCESDG